MRKPWVIAVLLLVALITVLLAWPSASYDLARVHPSLRDLPRPYRAVIAYPYQDADSIAVQVIGADGTTLDFTFQAREHPGRKSDFPQIFFDGKNSGKEPRIEITNSPDTRAMLFRLIDSDTNIVNRISMVSLRGSPMDYLRLAPYEIGRRLFR